MQNFVYKLSLQKYQFLKIQILERSLCVIRVSKFRMKIQFNNFSMDRT